MGGGGGSWGAEGFFSKKEIGTLVALCVVSFLFFNHIHIINYIYIFYSKIIGIKLKTFECNAPVPGFYGV